MARRRRTARRAVHGCVGADVSARDPRADRLLSEVGLGARQRPHQRGESADRTDGVADGRRAACRAVRRRHGRITPPHPSCGGDRARSRGGDRTGPAFESAHRFRQRLRENGSGQRTFRRPDHGRSRSAQLRRRRVVDDRPAGGLDVLRRAGHRAGLRLARHRAVHRAEHPGGRLSRRSRASP